MPEEFNFKPETQMSRLEQIMAAKVNAKIEASQMH